MWQDEQAASRTTAQHESHTLPFYGYIFFSPSKWVHRVSPLLPPWRPCLFTLNSGLILRGFFWSFPVWHLILSKWNLFMCSELCLLYCCTPRTVGLNPFYLRFYCHRCSRDHKVSEQNCFADTVLYVCSTHCSLFISLELWIFLKTASHPGPHLWVQ